MTNILKAALWYAKEGYHVVPVRQDKKCHIKWAEYQERKPTNEEIKQWWGKWPEAMIGIITGKQSGVSIIDVDSYKMNDIQYEDFSKVFEGFPHVETPIAKSPKGGYHFWFIYDPRIPNKPDIYKQWVDGRNDGNYIIAPPSENGKGKYQWIKKIKQVPFANIPSIWLSSIINNINSNYTDSHKQSHPVTNSHIYFTEGRRDNDLFSIANAMAKARLKTGFIAKTLELIAKNMGDEFDETTIRAKVNSALQRVDRADRTIAEEARQWVLSQPGHFRSQDGHNELHLVTNSHKHAFNMALLRMAEGDNPIIKKYGKQRGVYTRIESDLEEINWRESQGQEIAFEWMMGFSKFIKTMPKTVYIIAGDPDAGKSALCLNLAIQNCGKIPVSYFSSEMGADELASRIRLYEDLDEELVAKGIKFYERDGNFEDVIKPNEINIVDYFEISENFWEIAENLKQIRHNLNKGIAIVAVQKKRGATLGRGAEFGLEKPRLYALIEPYKGKFGYDGNIITIAKAKNWRDPQINPNGYTMRFKLVKGINMVPIYSDWRPEIEGSI